MALLHRRHWPRAAAAHPLDELAEVAAASRRPLAPEADAAADLGVRAERLVHLTGAATVRTGAETQVLDPAVTVALSPGEAAYVRGEGEMLLVGAA